MEWLGSIEMNRETLALLGARKVEESRHFKLRVHERVGELEKEMEKWAELRLAHIDKGEEVRKVKECRFAVFTLTLWPSVRNPQRATVLFKLVYWLFLVNDVLDTVPRSSQQVGALVSHLRHAIFGRPLDRVEKNIFNPSSPKELLLVEVGIEWWREIQGDPHVSSTQLKRLETTLFEHLLSKTSMIHLGEIMEANKIPSLEEYMSTRRFCYGIPLCFLCTEYELGIDLSNDDILNHPLMKQLHKAIADYCAGLNDFFSYPKEFLEGRNINLLPLLHIYNNIEAQQAGKPLVPFHLVISQAWEMINKQEEDCARIASIILKAPPLASHQSIKQYVENICGFTSAIRIFTTKNQRYIY